MSRVSSKQPHRWQQPTSLPESVKSWADSVLNKLHEKGSRASHRSMIISQTCHTLGKHNHEVDSDNVMVYDTSANTADIGMAVTQDTPINKADNSKDATDTVSIMRGPWLESTIATQVNLKKRTPLVKLER